MTWQNKPVNILKLKRIIRLNESGVNKLNIPKQVNISRRILDKYLQRIEESGKTPEQLCTLSEGELHDLIHPPKSTFNEDPRYKVLCSKIVWIDKELRLEGVTLKTLKEEYVLENGSHYGYTQFCEYYSPNRTIKGAGMHIDREPENTLEVDFAGGKLPLYDRLTDEIRTYCSVMFCTLSYSGLGYGEAMENASKDNLFYALNNALRYIGGVLVNVKSGNYSGM